MIVLEKIALFFFDLIDKHYHQKRIINFLIKNKIKISVFIDVGAHLGTYTNLITKNYYNWKYLWVKQSRSHNLRKRKFF